jgi:hypothetical protein
LKREGVWRIDAWTFISNYPIAGALAEPVILLGRQSHIDVGWRGPDYLAEVLQKYRNVRQLFPNLFANEIMEQLDVIIEKLEKYRPSEVTEQLAITWPPCSVVEQRELVIQQPIGWEVLLFAGILLQEKEKLQFKWRDYEIGYALPSGRHLGDREALSYLSNIMRDTGAIVRSTLAVFSEENKIQTFGAPGEPGNPMLIAHFARRIIGGYEEFLDWAADLRGTSVSQRMTHIFERAAVIVGQPARDIHNFMDQIARGAERLSAWLSNPIGNPPDIRVGCVFTPDHGAVTRFNIELNKLSRELLAP